MCAELAAQRAGAHELRALEAELRKFQEALATQDPEGAVAADRHFHLALARGAGNAVFVDEMIPGLDPAATGNRYRAVSFYTKDRRLFDWHRAIFDAVRRRDPKAARPAVLRHMRAIKNVETVLAKA